ncbi:MAG TPA: DUF3261 domain-containing protein [Arenimonas sp.]|nr:DUF3261 domain-containing protein [Arenimonas sp.]
MALAACASKQPAPMLPLSNFGLLQQNELITLTTGEHEIAFMARVENDNKLMRVVAITPTGQRLFSFVRSNTHLETEAGPLWPKQIPLESVWSDIEMLHALPHAYLQANWRTENIDGGTNWYFRNTLQARVKQDAGKIALIKPQYRLTLELLPE